MEIALQKQIASMVHSQLSLIDSECILVGGAPRDWYHNKEASDLDFFFVPDNNINIKTFMEVLDLDLTQRLSKVDHHLCNLVEKPLSIWEGVFLGLNVQLVEIPSKDIREVAVDELHLSLSKLWWTPSKGTQMHSEFKKTIETKVIYRKKGYDLKSTYAQKVLHKYGELGYSFIED